MEDNAGNHEIALKNAQHPAMKDEILDRPEGREQISDEDRFFAAIQAHMVFPGLVIGSENNCQKAIGEGFKSFSVRHVPCGHDKCLHIPYLDMESFVGNVEDMRSAADILYQEWAQSGNKIYVHCFHGIERAPLIVAYMIKRHVLPGFPFHNVYRWVLAKRHFAQDRRHWLPEEIQREVGIWQI